MKLRPIFKVFWLPLMWLLFKNFVCVVALYLGYEHFPQFRPVLITLYSIGAFMLMFIVDLDNWKKRAKRELNELEFTNGLLK